MSQYHVEYIFAVGKAQKVIESLTFIQQYMFE